jgi:hypothetical protein
VSREGGSVLALYRQHITAAMYPDTVSALRDYSAANRQAARLAIQQYRQSAADLAGEVDLLLTFVEAGTGFTREYGDIDEEFYDDLECGLEDAAALLRSADGLPLYPRFRERLNVLARRASPVGWGYGDFVAETVQGLEADLGEEGM